MYVCIPYIHKFKLAWPLYHLSIAIRAKKKTASMGVRPGEKINMHLEGKRIYRRSDDECTESCNRGISRNEIKSSLLWEAFSNTCSFFSPPTLVFYLPSPISLPRASAPAVNFLYDNTCPPEL